MPTNLPVYPSTYLPMNLVPTQSVGTSRVLWPIIADTPPFYAETGAFAKHAKALFRLGDTLDCQPGHSTLYSNLTSPTRNLPVTYGKPARFEPLFRDRFLMFPGLHPFHPNPALSLSC